MTPQDKENATPALGQNTTEQDANSAHTPATPAPAKQKTAVGKIIADIEAPIEAAVAFVGKEAGIIAKLFAQEEPVVQDALKQVSQAVQVIKTTTGEKPDVVSYLLRQINPAWDEDTLNGLLSSAAVSLNVPQAISAPTLSQTIVDFQTHISQLPDDLSNKNFFTGLFNTLGSLVAPGTIWSKIVTFGIFIYNTFVR